MRETYKLPEDYKCTGSAYLVGTGPGLDAYTWPDLKDEDYILPVNFAGISCPRYNAFVALDTNHGALFDQVYPKNTICWTMYPRVLMNRAYECRIFRPLPGAGCSSGATGICVLYWLGYRKITIIGFDSYFTGKHEHAASLVKKGLYSPRIPNANRVLTNAVDKTIASLVNLQVVFWNPNGDHLLRAGSVDPSKP